MDVIVVLLCLAIMIAGGFVVAFVWAVRSGQYDDMTTPAARMVAEPDQEPSPPSTRRQPPKTHEH